jgi:hypothetical protein
VIVAPASPRICAQPSGLIFWKDCSMKRVGLGISDHPVRNRLRAALAQLRLMLVEEQEVVDGASA